MDDEQLFNEFVKDVKKIQPDTVQHQIAKPKAKVNKHKYNDSVHTTTQTNNSSNLTDSFFAHNLTKKQIKSIQLGQLPHDAILDLHGHTVDQAQSELVHFIKDCLHQRIQHALIIHGQGHNSAHGSVLKPNILHWLSQRSVVQAYCPAQQSDGGKGATYIMVKESE